MVQSLETLKCKCFWWSLFLTKAQEYSKNSNIVKLLQIKINVFYLNIF